MKKYMLFIILLFSMLALMACSKSNDNELNTGTYVMELEKKQSDDNEKILPTIFIDINKKEFTFSYDVLSSYFTIVKSLRKSQFLVYISIMRRDRVQEIL